MNRGPRVWQWLWPVGLALAGGLAHAGNDTWGEQHNRFGFNMRAAFSLEANFRNLGGFPAQTDVGPTASGSNHEYDDGYNRVDSQGNAGGLTYYWGYDQNSQVIGGENIVMSSTSAQPTGRLDGVSDDPHWGAEITYTREIGWNGSYWYGVVLGLNWLNIRVGERGHFVTDATRVSDSYRVAEPPPPPAPYRGGYSASEGGRQISDTPVRTTAQLAGAAETTGTYDLEAEAYGGRLGLLFETPFTDWLDLQFGGGVTGMWIHGDFTVDESTSLANVGSRQQRLSDSDQDFVVGVYGELAFNVHLTKRLCVTAGAQYHYLTDYSQQLGEKEVELNFEGVVFGMLGINYAF